MNLWQRRFSYGKCNYFHTILAINNYRNRYVRTYQGNNYSVFFNHLHSKNRLFTLLIYSYRHDFFRHCYVQRNSYSYGNITIIMFYGTIYHCTSKRNLSFLWCVFMNASIM